MNLENKRIGFVMTGSFCTFSKTIEELKIIANNNKVIPIMSENSYKMDTKFGKAKDFIKEIEDITGNNVLHTIQEVEPIGPKDMLDILIVAPATGNTIAKLANDIIDDPATMAVNAHVFYWQFFILTNTPYGCIIFTIDLEVVNIKWTVKNVVNA